MSVRSSYRIVFTTSVTCVVRLTCGDARWTRSPIPVSDGVNTSCPASRSGPRTYLNPYDPPHAPCTRTNVVIARTIDFPYRLPQYAQGQKREKPVRAGVAACRRTVSVLTIVLGPPISRDPFRISMPGSRIGDLRNGKRRESGGFPASAKGGTA